MLARNLPADLVEFIRPWCADDGVRRKQNSVEAKRRKAEERAALQEKAAAADVKLVVLRETYQGVCGSATNLGGIAGDEAEYLGRLADYIALEVPEVMEGEPAQQEGEQAAEDLAWDEAAPAEGNVAADESDEGEPAAEPTAETEEVEEAGQPAEAPPPEPEPKVNVGDIPPWLRRY